MHYLDPAPTHTKPLWLDETPAAMEKENWARQGLHAGILNETARTLSLPLTTKNHP